jgi:adenylate cyclase
MLNEVFTELFEAVASTHGILDKYIGDAVMAVYGVPFAGDRDARNAVDAAVAMQRMIDEINVKRTADARSELRLGVGIATGDVVAGTVGSPKRMDYTVIGDSVNLASRLQDLTKLYRCGVMVCAQTAREVEGSHALRELDTVRVRGRDALEHVFEVVVPHRGLEGDALIAWLDLYQTGRARLMRRDWEGAHEAFDAILAEHPDDGPAQLMRDRAARAMIDPPPPEWDGTW